MGRITREEVRLKDGGAAYPIIAWTGAAHRRQLAVQQGLGARCRYSWAGA